MASATGCPATGPAPASPPPAAVAGNSPGPLREGPRCAARPAMKAERAAGLPPLDADAAAAPPPPPAVMAEETVPPPPAAVAVAAKAAARVKITGRGSEVGSGYVGSAWEGGAGRGGHAGTGRRG